MSGGFRWTERSPGGLSQASLGEVSSRTSGGADRYLDTAAAAASAARYMYVVAYKTRPDLSIGFPVR